MMTTGVGCLYRCPRCNRCAAEAALFTEPVPEVATETVEALSPLLIGVGITYRF